MRMGTSPPPGTLLSEIRAALNALYLGAALWRAEPQDLHGAVRLFGFRLFVFGLLETCDHFGGDRLLFDPPRIAGIAFRPDPCLEALDRKRAAFPDPVLELEGRLAAFYELGFDRDVVAEAGRLTKTRARRHHSMPGEIVGLEVCELVHAQHALDERGGAGIEDFEIARIEDDPG